MKDLGNVNDAIRREGSFYRGRHQLALTYTRSTDNKITYTQKQHGKKTKTMINLSLPIVLEHVKTRERYAFN